MSYTTSTQLDWTSGLETHPVYCMEGEELVKKDDKVVSLSLSLSLSLINRSDKVNQLTCNIRSSLSSFSM